MRGNLRKRLRAVTETSNTDRRPLLAATAPETRLRVQHGLGLIQRVDEIAEELGRIGEAVLDRRARVTLRRSARARQGRMIREVAELGKETPV